MKTTKAVLINVRGRVQGVGFRYYTEKKANELNIKGFVENKGDGSVYIEAEGDVAELEHFVTWVRQGPPWARVQEITVTEMPAVYYTKFCIR